MLSQRTSSKDNEWPRADAIQLDRSAGFSLGQGDVAVIQRPPRPPKMKSSIARPIIALVQDVMAPP